MVKSIKQLRAERDKLLTKSTANKASLMERKKLELEIKALKNPRASDFKKDFSAFTRSAGVFLRKRGKIISANLDRINKEERASRRKSVKKRRR